MKQGKNSLAIKMTIALIAGIVTGFIFILLREKVGGNSDTWKFINSLLFQDISAKGAERSLGIFYIIGQLFVNSLQLVIIPMVFTSITLAMCHISDSKKLGRISYKTLSFFLISSLIALVIAGIVGMLVYKAGGFNVKITSGINMVKGKSGSNPLLVFMSIVPNNIFSAFSNNGGVLATVFLAVSTGLCINVLGDKIKYLKTVFQEINDIVVKFFIFCYK